MQNVLLLGESLFGIGHLNICADLAKAFGGKNVTFATATPIPSNLFDFGGANLVQLPNIINNPDGKRQAIDKLFQLIRSNSYDIICFETWPLGRRDRNNALYNLDPMYKSILDYYKNSKKISPTIYCSTREILYPNIDEKTSYVNDWAEETVDLIKKYNIKLLVHGDKNFIDFQSGFPLASTLEQESIIYTGYFVNQEGGCGLTNSHGSVLVTAGGGKVGMPLYKMVVEGFKQNLYYHPVIILTGPRLADEDIEYLKDHATQYPLLSIEQQRPKNNIFADVSVVVTQAGYGACSNILANLQAHIEDPTIPLVSPVFLPWGNKETPGVPHDFKPYLKEGALTEQGFRAAAFENNNIGIALQENLTPQNLAAAVAEAYASRPTLEKIVYIPRTDANFVIGTLSGHSTIYCNINHMIER